MVHNISGIPPPPSPKTPLGRYRILSPTASVRVSPFCLSGMSFGTGWGGDIKGCSQKKAETTLDFYYDNGGNFIDTSNNYQGEESEKIIGDWMARRGNRDQLIVSTKYSTNFRAERGDSEIMINSTGNSAKSLITSVNASLEKLQTDYIDILYVHWWDHSTSYIELMQSLNHLVAAGKILYLGVSNMPAWVVSRANEYARTHGLRQFSVYQGRWSASSRDLEREIAPMAQSEGMAVVVTSAISGPVFMTSEQRLAYRSVHSKMNDQQAKLGQVLQAIADEKETSPVCIGFAYVMQKQPYVFPLIPNPTVSALRESMQALTMTLSKTDMARIQGAARFEPGFPHDLLSWNGKETDPWLPRAGGHIDYVPPQEPIRPSPGKPREPSFW